MGKIIFKDLIGELAGEDIKFLYWCWENRKSLNKIRLNARPAKAIIHLNSSGDIKSYQIECGGSYTHPDIDSDCR